MAGSQLILLNCFLKSKASNDFYKQQDQTVTKIIVVSNEYVATEQLNRDLKIVTEWAYQQSVNTEKVAGNIFLH